MASFVGQPRVRGSSEAMRMALLNFTSIGIAFTWSIEMTYCTPYLLSLGLTKSNTSLVWIAGPLSGIVVQPIVGVVSDESNSRWGRRRPILLLGTAIVCLCLLILGFTKEIVQWLIPDPERAELPTIVLAVLSIYSVDFAINAVMSCSRSLVVDTLPVEKQQAGAAWSSRMGAVGTMIAYAAGAVDLAPLVGTALGDTQFKRLSVIAIFVLSGSIALTCWAVTERRLVAPKPVPHQVRGRLAVFHQIWSAMRDLPPRIRLICWIQFWSWIGWFPFLFYGTTWIGETYFRYDLPSDARQSQDLLGEVGRVGSTSLVIFSVITSLGAFLLPLAVKSSDDADYTRRPPQAIAGALERLRTWRPDLLTAWTSGHLMFSASMLFAPLARSYRFATFLVCLCALPWTVSGWAPTTFLGEEVNKMSGHGAAGPSYRALSDLAEDELPRLSDAGLLQPEQGPDSDAAPSSTGQLSGIYFGILNVYTTLPQFIGTFISTVVFAILEPGQSPELAGDGQKATDGRAKGPNAIAVCLFIGAVSTLVAAHGTRKLRRT